MSDWTMVRCRALLLGVVTALVLVPAEATAQAETITAELTRLSSSPRDALNAFSAFYTLSGGTLPYVVTQPSGDAPVDSLVVQLRNSDEVWVEGRLFDAGALEVPLTIEDSEGEIWSDTLEIEVQDLELTVAELMVGFARRSEVRADTPRYLDNAGNETGRFDVGDLRAYLERAERITP